MARGDDLEQVPDCAFECAGAAGAPAEIALSQLFAADTDTLAMYSCVFGPGQEAAHPSCTAILDALDEAVENPGRRVAFAVVADGPLERIHAHAAARGWRRLPLVSAANNQYGRAYGGLGADGSAVPTLNVFRRERSGAIRHVRSSELRFERADRARRPIYS